MTSSLSNPSASPHAVHVRIGAWFEASASGWGVVVVPFVLCLLAALAFAAGPIPG